MAADARSTWSPLATGPAAAACQRGPRDAPAAAQSGPRTRQPALALAPKALLARRRAIVLWTRPAAAMAPAGRSQPAPVPEQGPCGRAAGGRYPLGQTQWHWLRSARATHSGADVPPFGTAGTTQLILSEALSSSEARGQAPCAPVRQGMAGGAAQSGSGGRGHLARSEPRCSTQKN